MGAKAVGLDELRDDLRTAVETSVEEARKVVAKGSLNIKNDAKRIVSGYSHLPAYPRSISYDTKVEGTVASSEIGPDKAKKQGALGNIIEYGDGGARNAPIPHLSPALDLEESKFAQAMEDLGAQLLEGQKPAGDAPASG